MKRIITLTMAFLICFSVTFTMTACTSDPEASTPPTTTSVPKHPIEEFISRMRDADSAQMTMTMSDVPFLGTITMITKHDGNIEYTSGSLISDESYIETINDLRYEYTKNDDGKWIKSLITEDESEDDSNDLTTLFENPENFEKVEGKENTYKQKSSVTFDDFDNVVITIEDDTCTIEMTMISDDMICGCKIVISHIGEIELTLPDVTE